MAKTQVKVRKNVFGAILDVTYALEQLMLSVAEDCPEAKPAVSKLCKELYNWDLVEHSIEKEGWHKIDLEKLSEIVSIAEEFKAQIGK